MGWFLRSSTYIDVIYEALLMNYGDYIRITPSERKKHLSLLLSLDSDDYQRSDNFDKIIALIRAADKKFLVKLALKLPVFDEICKHPKLDAYWNNIRKNVGFHQGSKPTHIFNLIKGKLIYEQYLVEKQAKNEKNAPIFLKKSAEFGYPLALETLSVNPAKGEHKIPSLQCTS